MSDGMSDASRMEIEARKRETVVRKETNKHPDDTAKAGRVYEHYKGGLYTCVGLFRHHETRERMVAYVSLETGAACARELDLPDSDAWSDFLWLADGREVMRFEEVAPSKQPR